MDNREVRLFRPASVVAGGMLLVVGIAMLIDRTHTLSIDLGRIVGPFAVIGLGVAMVLERGAFVVGRAAGKPRRRGDASSGLWLIGVGAWMLVSELHLFGLTYGTSWPLFIILSGIMMVVRGTMPSRRVEREPRHD